MARVQAVAASVPVGEPERTGVLQDLFRQLGELDHSGFAEIWVDHDQYPSLCALVNGENAWLMCIRYDGDGGFSSRNPAYAGAAGATLEFYLSNGQRDVYPMAWAYPTVRVLEAIRQFAEQRKVPEWVVWHNDSGDGTASPNEPWVQAE